MYEDLPFSLVSKLCAVFTRASFFKHFPPMHPARPASHVHCPILVRLPLELSTMSLQSLNDHLEDVFNLVVDT